MGDSDLWLDEPTERAARARVTAKRIGVVAAAILGAAAVAVPIALVAVGGSPARSAAGHRTHGPARLVGGPARHQVLQALSTTTDAGNFAVSYTLDSTPPTAPTTNSNATTCTALNGTVQNISGAFDPGGPALPAGTTPTTMSGSPSTTAQTVCQNTANPVQQVHVAGAGVIDTDPMAMVVSANIGAATSGDPTATSGLDVVVRVDGTTVYEGGGGASLAPTAADNSTGTELPEFAGLTEGTLGQKAGAVAMMGLSSPTGYLDLYQQGITAASRTRTGTVDGVPVTQYTVSVDLNSVLNTPGTTSDEVAAMTGALNRLNQQGFTGDTDVVSIDAAGYIREVSAVDSFKDGATVTLDSTFSDFGCAGTVLMPGQQGPASPPAGCTSPDSPSTGATTTTVTTTAGGSSTTSTSAVPPPVPSIGSTVPASTTIPPVVSPPAETVPPTTSTTAPGG